MISPDASRSPGSPFARGAAMYVLMYDVANGERGGIRSAWTLCSLTSQLARHL
ncbi:hypothetical protein C8Q80DRAFT_1138961 [Daedaleopsis nitida]|nr:hypothetical protein C8Q80DRAFT_1138961 [Daedaleopsis nitida]